MSTLRGCPPRWVCGGGISGAKIPHCASVRSEGYRFRDRPSVAKCVYSFTGEACANCLPNQAFCQGQFPESLLLLAPVFLSLCRSAGLCREAHRAVRRDPCGPAFLAREKGGCAGVVRKTV